MNRIKDERELRTQTKGLPMLARAHYWIGIASSLAATTAYSYIANGAPLGVAGTLCTLAAGAAGAMIPDWDQRYKKEDSVKDIVASKKGSIIGTLLTVALVVAIGYQFNLKVSRFVVANMTPWTIGALVLFLTLFILVLKSSHRSFSHSLIAWVAMSGALYVVFPILGVAFAAGMASHIALDLFNQKGPRLFFPLKKRPSLKKCLSEDNVINNRLALIGSVITVSIAAVLIVVNVAEWQPYIVNLVIW